MESEQLPRKRKQIDSEESEGKPKKTKMRIDADVQRVLNKFKETYNGLYLKAIIPFVASIISLKEEPFFFTQFNRVQKKLFLNFMEDLDDNSSRLYKMYTYIEGPHYLSHFKTKDQNNDFRTFYIFGEKHEQRFKSVGKCSELNPSASASSFLQYLAMLTYETFQFLDVYIEVFSFTEDTFGMFTDIYWNDITGWEYNLFQSFFATFTSSPTLMSILYHFYNGMNPLPPPTEFDTNFHFPNEILGDIQDTFSVCFDPSNRLLKREICDLARFHFIDIRNQMVLDSTSWLLKVHLFRCFLHKSYVSPILKTPDDISLVASFMNSLVAGLHLTWFFNEFERVDFSSTKLLSHCSDLIFVLHKQLNKARLHPFRTKVEVDEERSAHPAMRQVIIDFVGNELDQQFPPSQVVQTWTSFKTAQSVASTMDELYDIFEKLSNYLLYFFARVMDCYCLSRVFRKFSHKPEQILQQPLTPSTYIIYAGKQHSELYHKFILHLISNQTLTLVGPVWFEWNQHDKNDISTTIDCVHLPKEHQL
jgi:hypothetical protein